MNRRAYLLVIALLASHVSHSKSYYMHTPPVPEDARAVSKAQAMELWEKLLRAIADAMQVGGSLSSITVALDSAGLDGWRKFRARKFFDPVDAICSENGGFLDKSKWRTLPS